MEFNPGEIGHIEVRKSEQKQESGLKLEQDEGPDGKVTVRKITELFKRRNTGLHVGDVILKLNGKEVGDFKNLNEMKLLIKRETLIKIVFQRPFPEESSAEEEVDDEEESESVHALVVYEDDDDPEKKSLVPYEEVPKSKKKTPKGHQAVVPYDATTKTTKKEKKTKGKTNAVVAYDATTASATGTKKGKGKLSDIVPRVDNKNSKKVPQQSVVPYSSDSESNAAEEGIHR